jgi:hypothetical protein
MAKSVQNTVGGLISFFFVGCILVMIMTHASGFAKSAGAIFNSLDDFANILSGQPVGKSLGDSHGKERQHPR